MPYTVALLSAVPVTDPRPKKTRIVLRGEVPSPSKPPTGCAFHPRCPLTRQLAAQSGGSETVPITFRGVAPGANGDTTSITSGGETVRVMRKCVEQAPPLEQKQGEPGHVAACWFTQ